MPSPIGCNNLLHLVKGLGSVVPIDSKLYSPVAFDAKMPVAIGQPIAILVS